MAAVLPSGRLTENTVLVQATRTTRVEHERPLSKLLWSSMAPTRAAACRTDIELLKYLLLS